jgi:hypothetical protein
MQGGQRRRRQHKPTTQLLDNVDSCELVVIHSQRCCWDMTTTEPATSSHKL